MTNILLLLIWLTLVYIAIKDVIWFKAFIKNTPYNLHTIYRLVKSRLGK